MTDSFTEHFDRARRAQSNREHAAARASFEAALSAAVAPHEKALALNGLADTYFTKDEERALELMEQAVATCLPQPDGETPKDVGTAFALALTWYDMSALLSVMNRDQDALAAVDQTMRRFLDRSMNPPQSEQERQLTLTVVRSLRMKVSLLDGLERIGEALACCDDLIERFGNVGDSKIQVLVARAMFKRAYLFGRLGRQDKEIAACDELATRFGDSRDPDLTEAVLDALERKTRIYQDQDDLEIVIEVCDEIVRRYGDDSHWRTANSVARAMVRRAVARGKRGEHVREMLDYDQVVQRHSESPEALLRIHAAKALMFKAVTLNDADQSTAEMECHDEVIRRFGEDPDEEIRAVAADALIYKGMTLGAIAEDAADDIGVRDVEAEIACYDEAIRRYGADESIHLQRAVAEALLHKAETLLEAGRIGEALPCLDQLIAAYIAIKDEELAETVKEARALKADI
jgi:tetratricopeptide (TPR) repeat protein